MCSWIFQYIAGLREHSYIIAMTVDEEKLVHKYCEEAFRGRTIRQVEPTCDCGKVFTEKEIAGAPAVYFRDVEVFGRIYTLIEPVCPVCKKKIEANFYIMN